MACESGFLDPELAGIWGGDNMEVTIEADRVTARQVCTTARFEGSVRLGEYQEFSRQGRVRYANAWRSVTLSAWLAHPDTMMASLYSNDPLADPLPPIPLVKGRPGTFNQLVLCVP